MGFFVSSMNPRSYPHGGKEPGLSSPCAAYRKLVFAFLLPSTAKMEEKQSLKANPSL